MKKFLAFLLALTCLSGLVACTGNGGEDITTQKPSGSVPRTFLRKNLRMSPPPKNPQKRPPRSLPPRRRPRSLPRSLYPMSRQIFPSAPPTLITARATDIILSSTTPPTLRNIMRQEPITLRKVTLNTAPTELETLAQPPY